MKRPLSGQWHISKRNRKAKYVLSTTMLNTNHPCATCTAFSFIRQMASTRLAPGVASSGSGPPFCQCYRKQGHRFWQSFQVLFCDAKITFLYPWPPRSIRRHPRSYALSIRSGLPSAALLPFLSPLSSWFVPESSIILCVMWNRDDLGVASVHKC